MKLNNDISKLTARHFNELKNAVCAIQTCKCDGGGTGISLAVRGGVYAGPTAVTGLADCCPTTISSDPIYYSGSAIGMTKANANSWYATYGDAGLIIEGEAPYEINSFDHPCAGDPHYEGPTYNDGALIVAGQGTYSETSGTNQVGSENAGDEEQRVADIFAEFNATPFNIAQLDRLPYGATCDALKIWITTEDVVETARFYEATIDADSGVITVTRNEQTVNSTDAPVSAALFAEDAAGEKYLIAVSAESAASNNSDEPFELDITSLGTAYLAARDGIYVRFAIALHPALGLAVSSISSGKSVIGALAGSMYSCTLATWSKPDDPCQHKQWVSSSETRKIEFTGWTLGDIYLTFTLPQMDGLKPPCENIPAFD